MTFCTPQSLTAEHALFLDFDGTLAPLQDDADSVRLTQTQSDMLLQLGEMRAGAMALISGRDIRDLASRAPRDLMRIGNHGLYTLVPKETVVPTMDALPESLQQALQDVVKTRGGAFLEIKGPVGTVHFRGLEDYGPILIDAVSTAVSRYPKYRTKIGNGVVEAIPLGANKGAALERTMQSKPFAGRIPVMVGDDTTDEDGFLAAQRLGGFGVKVGEGDTVARKWLLDVDAVWHWLRSSL